MGLDLKRPRTSFQPALRTIQRVQHPTFLRKLTEAAAAVILQLELGIATKIRPRQSALLKGDHREITTEDQMAEKRSDIAGGALRVLYYIFAAACFFLIFLLAVTLSPNRIDTELTLTLIIAVLLLMFMLHTSQLLRAIERRLDSLKDKLEKTG